MKRRMEDEDTKLKDAASLDKKAIERVKKRLRNSKLNLDALNAVKARFLTIRALAQDGIEVHERLWQDWNLKTLAARDKDFAENANYQEETLKRALDFVSNNKNFKEARSRLLAAALSNGTSSENTGSGKRYAENSKRTDPAKRQLTERTVGCRVTGCNAMFGTKEAMETHVKRRHACASGSSKDGSSASMFVDSLVESGIDDFIKSQKKNRPGQRQRRREAILKEIAEGKYEGKEVPALDRPSRAKVAAGKRSSFLRNEVQHIKKALMARILLLKTLLLQQMTQATRKRTIRLGLQSEPRSKRQWMGLKVKRSHLEMMMRRIKRSAFIKSTYNFDIAHCTYNITWMKLFKIYLQSPFLCKRTNSCGHLACTPKSYI